MSCIFCDIVNKKIESYKIYEDENVYAFLDISQCTKGHTLLIPKKHVSDIFFLDEENAKNLFAVVPKISNALKNAFNANGINIISNNKVEAGQTVFHFHIHLIPRYDENDLFSINFREGTNPKEGKLVKLQEQIVNELNK